MTSGQKPAHRVCILVPGLEGGIDRLFEHLNLDAHRSPEIDLFLFRTHGKLIKSLFLFGFRLLHFIYLCASGSIDLCHINVASKGSTLRKVIFSLICRMTGTRYLLHLHGGMYREFFGGLPRPLKYLVRSMFRHADRIITLGRVWQTYIVQELGVAPDKVLVLPNGVPGPREPEGLDRQKSVPPRILFLGRLGDMKGVPELVRALASPDLKDLAWDATLAGDGEVEKYRKEIGALGLGDRVAVPGWLGAEDTRSLLSQSSILALPSHIENLPLSVLEGMAYQLCPVVTPVGAVPDVIRDGENGLIVPVNDPAALAHALVDLLQHPEKRREMAAKARRDFEQKYDIHDYLRRLESVYSGILMKAGHVGDAVHRQA
jgi:glycosyltransferase involved in cell wall biosynthesis